MRPLKIALLQIAPANGLSGNLEKGIRACCEAAALGADIALFPEMWSNGYAIYGRPVAEWQAEAVDPDGDFVKAFAHLAAELGMAIGITLLERTQGDPRNSLILFDRFGQRRLTYAKVHTCDFEDERHLTPGNGFSVAELDTACGAVKVGAMICFDRAQPESARILMLKGAELILVPNACPMEINSLAQLRGRACENMLAIATCNYPAGVPDCNGGSSAFDGVMWLPELPESRDTCILQAGRDEGIYIAELDLEQLRAYRRREIFGNAYRRPELYGLLTDAKVEAPFIRSDRRRRFPTTHMMDFPGIRRGHRARRIFSAHPVCVLESIRLRFSNSPGDAFSHAGVRMNRTLFPLLQRPFARDFPVQAAPDRARDDRLPTRPYRALNRGRTGRESRARPTAVRAQTPHRIVHPAR